MSVILVGLAATGCASEGAAGPAAGGPQTPPVGQDHDAQAKANRAKAERDAALLLALVEVPAGSVELTTAPAALPGPALGSAQSDTTVDLARYWRVPLSLPALEAYLQQHPPAGLSQSGSRSWEGPAITSGDGWVDDGSGPRNQLHIGVAPIGVPSEQRKESYLRVDALTTWVDPRPIADDAAGQRMRIEAGDRCPAESKGIVGVRNEGADLDHNLVPADKPNAGLLCAYAGLNGASPFGLSLERVLTAAEAARVAEAAHQVTLSHYDAMRACGMDDRSATVLVLGYSNRPAVNLWLPSVSCRGTSNGHIAATDLLTLGALRDVVTELSR